MKVYVEVHKIIKCAIYSTVFAFKWRCWWRVDEVAVNRTNYQGCQLDLNFIQCQTYTDISGIMNEIAQYVQNYCQFVYVPI